MSIHTFPRLASARPLTLGFLSPHNPFDLRAFSGTAFYAARALARLDGVQLRHLGNHRQPGILDRLRPARTPQTRFEDCDFTGLDAVVGLVASPLLDRMAETHPDLPFVHVTDATPRFLRDAYGWAVPDETDRIEARVVRKAAISVYSSEVLAERAPRDLGCPDMITAVQPFGVNSDAFFFPPKSSLDKVNLLFVGIDWVRKGGDIAVAALDELLARGHDAQLTIVGRCPDRHRHHPAIRALGFLNKNRPREAARLARLYAEAHLLLLPSRADCTPMVVAEAMARGTPVLASNVGGIAAQIGGSGAGRVLDLHSTPALWAETILDMTADPDRYGFLSDAAADRARTCLNWDTWAEAIGSIARAMTEPGGLEAASVRRDAKTAV